MRCPNDVVGCMHTVSVTACYDRTAWSLVSLVRLLPVMGVCEVK